MLKKSLFTLLFLMGILMMTAMASPLVSRGGTTAGNSTVTVETGHEVSVTWSTRTGSIQSALISSAQGNSSLDMAVTPPSWFILSESGDLIPLEYTWKGYRINGDQAILLHELKVPDGPTMSVEEHPTSIVGIGDLLSLQRTFKVKASDPVSTVLPRLIKRIRTGTNQGVTLLNHTNGQLQPLGLNDNFIADVVFVESGSTVITTSFTGHWVDQPDRPVNTKETSS